jgi:hypothetical protein
VTGAIWADPVDADGEISYEIGEAITKRTRELLPTEEHIRNEARIAKLDRDVVGNLIDDKIKKSIAALDDTPEDHSDRDD